MIYQDINYFRNKRKAWRNGRRKVQGSRGKEKGRHMAK